MLEKQVQVKKSPLTLKERNGGATFLVARKSGEGGEQSDEEVKSRCVPYKWVGTNHLFFAAEVGSPSKRLSV